MPSLAKATRNNEELNPPEEMNHEDGMDGREEMDHVENPSRAPGYIALEKERWCS